MEIKDNFRRAESKIIGQNQMGLGPELNELCRNFGSFLRGKSKGAHIQRKSLDFAEIPFF